MSAEVVPYSANPWDTSLSLKVECLDCRIEWGWADEARGTLDRLQSMADAHNAASHPRVRI